MNVELEGNEDHHIVFSPHKDDRQEYPQENPR